MPNNEAIEAIIRRIVSEEVAKVWSDIRSLIEDRLPAGKQVIINDQQVDVEPVNDDPRKPATRWWCPSRPNMDLLIRWLTYNPQDRQAMRTKPTKNVIKWGEANELCHLKDLQKAQHRLGRNESITLIKWEDWKNRLTAFNEPSSLMTPDLTLGVSNGPWLPNSKNLSRAIRLVFDERRGHSVNWNLKRFGKNVVKGLRFASDEDLRNLYKEIKANPHISHLPARKWLHLGIHRDWRGPSADK